MLMRRWWGKLGYIWGRIGFNLTLDYVEFELPNTISMKWITILQELLGLMKVLM